MESIRIWGTGSYVPPKLLKNLNLERMGPEASLNALDMADMIAKDPWGRN